MPHIFSFFCAFVATTALMVGCGGSDSTAEPPIRVLLITAHPDDETMFNLGRFRERGWHVSIALVTNGENGSVVMKIKQDYDPVVDDDVLIELDAGPGAWLTIPPVGPVIGEIATPSDLAHQRRREFLDSCAMHGMVTVYFLSDPDRADFEDSWDNGVRNWDQAMLATRLSVAVNHSRPDIIITLNPDETWAHHQHYGLARIVRTLWENGRFDLPDATRPGLYGIREHGWYSRSWDPQSGDLVFDRDGVSEVLGMSYEAYWREASSFYISQSSHPVWFDARVRVGILPGYGSVDLIRRLDQLSEREGLDHLFDRFPPNAQLAARLPKMPAVVDLSGE